MSRMQLIYVFISRCKITAIGGAKKYRKCGKNAVRNTTFAVLTCRRGGANFALTNN